jgi:hypothetical protein
MKAYTGARKTAGLDDRWRTFVAFWFGAALTLFGLGLAMFVAIAHSHRIAFVLLILAAMCLTVGLLIRRAGRQP